MKKLIPWVLIGVISLGGGLKYLGDRADWKADIERLSERREELQDSVNLYREQAIAVDTAAQREITRLEFQVGEERRRAKGWRDEARQTNVALEGTLEEVDDVVAVKIRSVVGNLNQQHALHVRALEGIIASGDSITVQWRKRYNAQVELNVRLTLALKESTEREDFWQNRAKPNLLTRVKRDIPKLAVAGLASILA